MCSVIALEVADVYLDLIVEDREDHIVLELHWVGRQLLLSLSVRLDEEECAVRAQILFVFLRNHPSLGERVIDAAVLLRNRVKFYDDIIERRTPAYLLESSSNHLDRLISSLEQLAS